MTTATIFGLFILLITARTTYIFWKHRRKQLQPRSVPCHVATFLGSGGHTTEALQLLAGLDRARYAPDIFIVSKGDSLSAQRASSAGAMRLLEIPRARAVHQPLATVPRTFILSLLGTLAHFTPHGVLSNADILLLNGPGTCVVLCVCVWVARFIGWRTPRVIYVESFARVRTLSLSATLLAPFVDRFVVQWPELKTKSRFAEHTGWLI